jgi:hypothetical protein
MQTEIPQAQLSDERLAGSDRTPRQVKTHKLTFWQLKSHPDEVAPVAATQFEYTTPVYGSRLHSAEEGNGGKPIRVALWENAGGIQNFIVCRLGIVRGFHTPLG